jgi:hypothetical protein
MPGKFFQKMPIYHDSTTVPPLIPRVLVTPLLEKRAGRGVQGRVQAYAKPAVPLGRSSLVSPRTADIFLDQPQL